MNYSLDSFYDVVRDELINNETLFNFFKENEMQIGISLILREHHFEKLDIILFPITPYGEFLNLLECVLTDYNHRRGEENMKFAMSLSFLLMRDYGYILEAQELGL